MNHELLVERITDDNERQIAVIYGREAQWAFTYTPKETTSAAGLTPVRFILFAKYKGAMRARQKEKLPMLE